MTPSKSVLEMKASSGVVAEKRRFFISLSWALPLGSPYAFFGEDAEEDGEEVGLAGAGGADEGEDELLLVEEGRGESSAAVGAGEIDGDGAFGVEGLAEVVEGFGGEAELGVWAEDGVSGEGFVGGDAEGFAEGEGFPAAGAGALGAGGAGEAAGLVAGAGIGSWGLPIADCGLGCGDWRGGGGSEGVCEVEQGEAGVALEWEGEHFDGVGVAAGEGFGVELGLGEGFAVEWEGLGGDVPAFFEEAFVDAGGAPAEADDDEVSVEADAVGAVGEEEFVGFDDGAVDADGFLGVGGFDDEVSRFAVDAADGGAGAVGCFAAEVDGEAFDAGEGAAGAVADGESVAWAEEVEQSHGGRLTRSWRG